MAKIKTSELTGPALDWAVAKAGKMQEDKYGQYSVLEYGHNVLFRPSSVWDHGGPIIEREHIYIRPTITGGGYRSSDSFDAIEARIELPNGAVVFNGTHVVTEYGPTPLIAAMRCYVASKLGDEMDIPEDLA